MPGIVACINCNARFAEGVKFCGRCGNRSFTVISEGSDKNNFTCPRCSTILPASAKFCGRCGLSNVRSGNLPSNQFTAKQPDFFRNIPKQVEKICRRCGERFPPNIKFCGRCGNNLS
ncbi:MAG: zinc ribbon domain-containing protein [Acidobacteria bacterium]|nr:zinc ribbon domain-containing protein [Acidobacteriota bacterium]